MSRALAARAPSPLRPDTFRSPYSPGPVRRSADAEHAAVAAFIERYPEYARLSHLEIATLAATYTGPERTTECFALEDAGVPQGWARPEDFNENGELA